MLGCRYLRRVVAQGVTTEKEAGDAHRFCWSSLPRARSYYTISEPSRPILAKSQGDVPSGVVSTCLAPCCGGDVIAQTLTDGRCVVCGLQYRRPVGAASWDEILGLVDITVSIGPSTEPLAVRSNGVIYRSENIYLDIATWTNATFKRSDVASIVPVQPVGVYQDALPDVSDPRLITDLNHGATVS
jgi:hypothetical protein